MNTRAPIQLIKPAITGRRLDWCIGRCPIAAKKQSGVTLFTALMFLTMLTLISLSTAQVSSLEEHMAANARSHDLAFQSAEAALRYVETNLGAIGPQIPVPADTASGTVTGPGLRAINTCLPNGNTYWNGSGEFDCNGNLQAFVWSAANAIQLTSNLTTLNQVEQYPWYIVERYPDSGVYQQYRVTTIGYGSDANTMVILQAMFHI